jgi:hypothetical protein
MPVRLKAEHEIALETTFYFLERIFSGSPPQNDNFEEILF